MGTWIELAVAPALLDRAQRDVQLGYTPERTLAFFRRHIG